MLCSTGSMKLVYKPKWSSYSHVETWDDEDSLEDLQYRYREQCWMVRWCEEIWMHGQDHHRLNAQPLRDILNSVFSDRSIKLQMGSTFVLPFLVILIPALYNLVPYQWLSRVPISTLKPPSPIIRFICKRKRNAFRNRWEVWKVCTFWILL